MDPKAAVEKYKAWGEVLTEEQFNEIVQTGSVALLSMSQRSSYLWWLAKRRSLDPLTKPYDLIPDKKGKLIIYANRACSDQLRLNQGLIDEITFQGHPMMGEKLRDDIYEVHVKLTDQKTGRSGEGIGCVPTAGLTGEDYANAKMKCHTKALRRATLAFCGEGIPDESEVDSFAAPGATPADVEVAPAPASVKPKMLNPLPIAAPPVKVKVS